MRSASQILASYLNFPVLLAGKIPFLQLDGYLTAIAVGPGLVRPDEWLAHLWPEEPALKDPKQAWQAVGALLDHYDNIVRQLDGPPENYRPLYLPVDPAQPPTVERASEWSQGFWRGMRVDPGWRSLMDDRAARYLLVPILIFARNDDGSALFPRTSGELEDILKDSAGSVAEFILLIREFFLQHAAQACWLNLQPPGRNDPCPCGSGKKYKRCCGAN